MKKKNTKDSHDDILETDNNTEQIDNIDDISDINDIDNNDNSDDDDRVDTKVLEVVSSDAIDEDDSSNSTSDEENVEILTKDETVDKVNNDSKVSKPKNNKKAVISIILIMAVIILLLVLIIVLNMKREDKGNDNDKNDEPSDVVLTEEDKKAMVLAYGEAIENVVLLSYQKDQKIISFEEANKLVKIEDDINCSEHEIYEDGKVYLNSCSVNGIVTSYSYGEKQEPKEKFDSGTMIKVYVNKETKVQTLYITDDESKYDVYTVHCDGVYADPELFNYGDYVFYYDSDYNVQMKNFKTDKKVLPNLNYIGVLPFKLDGYYDTKYVAVNINEKWGVYNLETGKAVIAPTYEAIAINLNLGTSGPPLYAETLKDNAISVYKNDKVGVINYTNGKEIIPINNNSLLRSGNYLWATYDDDKHAIYDFLGNKYLTEGYDKVYGISGGAYVLVLKDSIVKLIQLDGKVLYEYGENPDIDTLNFALEYNGEALFQLFKSDKNASMCVEYSYNPSDKKGVTKEIECGGIAKPILYLYPTKKTNVTVSFSHPEFLETTYPKFNNSWRVTAMSDGSLYDSNNKYYYALYWDEKKVHTVDFSEGFYVEKDDAIEFLEQKLSYIGLNDKEKNEFIMYWLPVLEKNGKSLVYFELTEERESYNNLLITPKPDSMLRMVIHIKKVDKKTDIKKQSLTKFKRVGFTAVEWGGTTY